MEKPLSEYGKSSRARDGLQFQCKSCIREWNSLYYSKNSTKVKKKVNEYRLNNLDTIKVKKKQRVDSIKHTEEYKEKQKARRKIWNSNNKGKKNYYTAQRRAKKVQATPEWVDTEILQCYYDLAKGYENQGLGSFHVDHIIPLTNEYICGLNVPWNLQILRDTENMKKSNQFDGTNDNEGWKENSTTNIN